MKITKYVLKLISASFVAFAILCLIASAYNLTPLREENLYGNTDYVWQRSFPWLKMTEGISYGITDEQGFNNLEVIKNPDILLLGSSHIEAMNVTQDNSTGTLLNEKFNGTLSTYNMGISGHTIYKVVQYLPESLSTFDVTPAYIVIETDSTILSGESVTQSLNGEVPITKVNNKGLVAWLQRFPYLRTVYHQLNDGMLDILLPFSQDDTQESVPESSTNSSDDVEIDEQPYEEMFVYLDKLQNEHNTKIIIAYHPFEKFEEDGDIYFSNEEYTDLFAKYADKYNVGFIDMTDSFERMYYENNKVPHGFATGALGEGHLNRYGHEAIATEIFEYISSMEVRE